MSEWHYSQQGRQAGPVSLEALRRMISGGQVQANDLVWNPTMSDWLPVANVPEAASALPAGGGGAAAVQPAQVLGYQGAMTEPIAATPQAIEWLRQTRPWARFIGILLYVVAGLMVVAGVVMAIPLVPMSGAMGCFYMVLALLYIPPGIFLNRYASRINTLMRMRRPEDLESALEAQKSFWKFIGIFALVILIIYGVIFLVLGLVMLAGVL